MYKYIDVKIENPKNVPGKDYTHAPPNNTFDR